jgi:DNA-directed RNA polymerase specialized sigma24 family protein
VSSWLFETTQDIADALCKAVGFYQASSTSLMRVRRQVRRPDAGPFRAGFLTAIDERAELSRLLGSLDARSRTLLHLWFVEDQPVTGIARQLGISRVHCYRLRDKALRAMLDEHLERTNVPERAQFQGGNGGWGGWS